MPHFDPERLALIALGELSPDSAETVHIDTCPQCEAELEELTHAAMVGRASIDGMLETPSPRVWNRIADELNLAPSASAADPGSTVLEREAAPIIPLQPSRRRTEQQDASPRRPWVWLVAAAAAVALVVGVGAGITAWLRPPVTPVASATLDPLPDWPGATGSAEIDEHPDGSRVLRLSLDPAASTAGYREVWLMRPDASGLVSLGLLAGSGGDFVIPQAVDLEEFSLVDVSAEPTDGDPAHSGDSIVRGQLRFS